MSKAWGCRDEPILTHSRGDADSIVSSMSKFMLHKYPGQILDPHLPTKDLEADNQVDIFYFIYSG